jgi:hypothetical protein
MFGGWIGAAYGAVIGFVIGAIVGPGGIAGLLADSQVPGAPDLQKVSFTSNTIGTPVCDVLGTTKLTGTLLYFGGERNEAQTQDTGGGGCGGGGETVITGYKYYMSWAIGLCVGPVDELLTVFRNDEVVWSGNLVRPESGGEETIVIPDFGSMTFYFGTDDQVCDFELLETFPGFSGTLLDRMQQLVLYMQFVQEGPVLSIPYHLNHRGLCWALFKDCYIGDYNRMPTMRFVLRKTPTQTFSEFNAIQSLDYNPAHALWYILHNMNGLPETWLDEDDFAEVASTLAVEGRGISMCLSTQQSAMDYLETINGHIDGILRYGGDGKFHPKLIRDDYTVGDLPLIDESVVLDDPAFSRKSWIDTINEVKVQYSKIDMEIGELEQIFPTSASFGFVTHPQRESTSFDAAEMEIPFNSNFNNAAGLIDMQIVPESVDALYTNWSWAANAGQQWGVCLSLGVDLGAKHEVESLRIYSIKYPGSGQWDTPHADHASFKIWTSDDKKTWTFHELVQPPGAIQYTGKGDGGYGCYFDISMTAKPTTRYILLMVNVSGIAAGGYGMDVAHEMKIWGRLITVKDIKQSTADPIAVDIGNKEIQERIVSKTFQMALFTANENAVWAGRNNLRKSSYPFAAVSFPANRNAFRLEVGDCFKFSYAQYGISNMVCRVLQIAEEGTESETITVQAMEDVFSISSAVTGFTVPTGHGIPAADYTVLPFIHQKIIEVPYVLSSDLKLLPIACKRSATDMGFNVYMSVNAGVSYRFLKRVGNLQPFGTLVGTYPVTLTIDDAIGFTIDFAEGAQSIGTAAWNDVFSGSQNTALLGDEIISFQSITPVSGTQYKLEGIIRGRYDTIMISHGNNTEFWMINLANATMISDSEIVAGASRKFKFVPYNLKATGSIADATAMTLVIGGRSLTPYAPTNFCANGSSTNARYNAGSNIILTWTPRFRGEGAGLGSPGTVLPTTDHEGLFEIEVWMEGVKVRTISAIDAATYTYTNAMNAEDRAKL